MDRVARCTRCGKRLVPTPTFGVEREYQCIWCNKPVPTKTDLANWPESPLYKSAPPRGNLSS